MTSGEGVWLLRYIDGKFEALEREMSLRIEAIDKASSEQHTGIKDRMEELNNVRRALNDQNATFLPRTEYYMGHNRVTEDVRILLESKARLEGKASMSAVYYAAGVGLLGVIVSIVNLLHSLGK
jgi:hypothetical protein